MKTVSIEILKLKMLEYFRDVERTGQELIITDNHRPVLKIVPFKVNKSFQETFHQYQGKAKYHNPLTEPESEDWG